MNISYADSQKNGKNISFNNKILNNTNKIIIRLSDEYMFDNKTYNEAYLGGVISKIDYDNIIIEATRIVGLSWSKKKNKDQVKLSNPMIASIIIIGVLSAVYMVTLYIATLTTNNTALVAVSLISILVALLLIIILSVVNFTSKLKRFKSLEEVIKIDLNQFLKKINVKFRNLSFNYIEDDKYIECINLNKIEFPEEGKNFINSNDNYNNENGIYQISNNNKYENLVSGKELDDLYHRNSINYNDLNNDQINKNIKH